LLNMFTFHATITSPADKREQLKETHEQEGVNLQAAFDLVEAKLEAKYPNHPINLSMGNRQPFRLRPAVKAQPMAEDDKSFRVRMIRSR
jgi:hypothetical protein